MSPVLLWQHLESQWLKSFFLFLFCLCIVARPFDIRGFHVVRATAIRCIAIPQGPNFPENSHKQHYILGQNNVT